LHARDFAEKTPELSASTRSLLDLSTKEISWMVSDSKETLGQKDIVKKFRLAIKISFLYHPPSSTANTIVQP
jgi:hypothetical protein